MSIQIKFQAIDITAGGALVEKVVFDKHGVWSDEGTWRWNDMDIYLQRNHQYKFSLDVEVHADALGVGSAIADFGGIWWSDSRIEWGYIDVPNVELNVQHYLTVLTYDQYGTFVNEIGMYIDGVRYYSQVYQLEVTEGTHTITVDYKYYRPGYVFTFQYWNDDYGYSTSRTRTVYINSDTTLKAYYKRTYIAGGCPTLYVWNGSEYVEEATLEDIHASSDVTVQHKIEETLVPDGSFYKLSLRELDEFTSHVDYVKLYAVDADGEWHECYLTRAIHSELGNVKRPLKFDDGRRVDLAPQQTVDLEFFLPRVDEIAYFIFEINGYNPKPL